MGAITRNYSAMILYSCHHLPCGVKRCDYKKVNTRYKLYGKFSHRKGKDGSGDGEVKGLGRETEVTTKL